MRPLAVAAIALVGALGAAACSSDDAGSKETTPTTAAPIPVGEAPVLIERIRPAAEALDEQLGGPQQYFEINADSFEVHLFVATEGATRATLYTYGADGTLTPDEPQVASGPTFAAADMTFDETRVLALTASQLPTSVIRTFAVAGVDGGGVTYTIDVQSELGTSFAVTVGPTGAVLGTDQLTPETSADTVAPTSTEP